ncbi:hypothetical protein PsorP6_006829 [Peronosclerospora sorghi]|uniref:Uncharacterized protein n=1 Tax=Peronosclerospora sorghi TaxID=230839 RepID=A0ACC0W9Q3_9STRA|nr:hypothetical protein PsorP6_006829 [Peronosclerospora sorghi]
MGEAWRQWMCIGWMTEPGKNKLYGVYVLLLVKMDGIARVIDHHHVALNPLMLLSFAVEPGDY